MAMADKGATWSQGLGGPQRCPIARGTPELIPLNAISHFEMAELIQVSSLEVITIFAVFDHPDVREVLSWGISYYETKSLTVFQGFFFFKGGTWLQNPALTIA